MTCTRHGVHTSFLETHYLQVFKYRCFFDTTSNSLLNLSHYMTIPSTHSNVPEPVADSLPCRTPSDGVSSVAETYAGLKRVTLMPLPAASGFHSFFSSVFIST